MNDLLIVRMGGQFGVFTTADARACGHDSLSLSRLLARGDIIRAGPRAYVDAAFATAKTTPEELTHWIERLTHRRLLERARHATRLADARSESPGESRARVVLTELGYTDIEPQVRVTDGPGRMVARVDLMVCGVLVVEFDGAVKYDGAQGREALVAEKKREDLLRQLGYGIVRLVWSDLAIPARVQAKMFAEIAILRQRRLW